MSTNSHAVKYDIIIITIIIVIITIVIICKCGTVTYNSHSLGVAGKRCARIDGLPGPSQTVCRPLVTREHDVAASNIILEQSYVSCVTLSSHKDRWWQSLQKWGGGGGGSQLIKVSSCKKESLSSQMTIKDAYMHLWTLVSVHSIFDVCTYLHVWHCACVRCVP